MRTETVKDMYNYLSASNNYWVETSKTEQAGFKKIEKKKGGFYYERLHKAIYGNVLDAWLKEEEITHESKTWTAKHLQVLLDSDGDKVVLDLNLSQGESSWFCHSLLNLQKDVDYRFFLYKSDPKTGGKGYNSISVKHSFDEKGLNGTAVEWYYDKDKFGQPITKANGKKDWDDVNFRKEAQLKKDLITLFGTEGRQYKIMQAAGVVSGPVMTAKANGVSYDAMIKAGWTEATLIANGMMEKPVAAAPSPPNAAASGHIMTEKAGGTTYEAMIKAGWTDDGMVKEGYMLNPAPAAPPVKTAVPPPPPNVGQSAVAPVPVVAADVVAAAPDSPTNSAPAPPPPNEKVDEGDLPF